MGLPIKSQPTTDSSGKVVHQVEVNDDLHDSLASVFKAHGYLFAFIPKLWWHPWGVVGSLTGFGFIALVLIPGVSGIFQGLTTTGHLPVKGNGIAKFSAKTTYVVKTLGGQAFSATGDTIQEASVTLAAANRLRDGNYSSKNERNLYEAIVQRGSQEESSVTSTLLKVRNDSGNTPYSALEQTNNNKSSDDLAKSMLADWDR